MIEVEETPRPDSILNQAENVDDDGEKLACVPASLPSPPPRYLGKALGDVPRMRWVQSLYIFCVFFFAKGNSTAIYFCLGEEKGVGNEYTPGVKNKIPSIFLPGWQASSAFLR